MPPRNPQRVIALAPEAREAPKYYLLTREDGFTGNDKYVRFWRGKGVLDLKAIHLERPDWVEHIAGEYVQITGVTLADYVTYWTRRHVEIKEITAEEAAAHRVKVEDEQRKEDQVQVAKQKARQKAKTLDQESRQQEMELEAEAKARQKLGLSADAPLPTPAKPAASAATPVAAAGGAEAATTDEKLPHEEGGAMVPEPNTGGDNAS